jgi:hypothetical protein
MLEADDRIDAFRGHERPLPRAGCGRLEHVELAITRAANLPLRDRPRSPDSRSSLATRSGPDMRDHASPVPSRCAGGGRFEPAFCPPPAHAGGARGGVIPRFSSALLLVRVIIPLRESGRSPREPRSGVALPTSGRGTKVAARRARQRLIRRAPSLVAAARRSGLAVPRDGGSGFLLLASPRVLGPRHDLR